MYIYRHKKSKYIKNRNNTSQSTYKIKVLTSDKYHHNFIDTHPITTSLSEYCR